MSIDAKVNKPREKNPSSTFFLMDQYTHRYTRSVRVVSCEILIPTDNWPISICSIIQVFFDNQGKWNILNLNQRTVRFSV